MSSSKHVHSPEENRLLEIRLRKIIGQLQSVEKMVSGHRDCIEILTQVVSARRALKSFAEIIIRSHAHDCIGGAVDPEEAHHKLEELLKVLERYVE
jgi:DNA-binding FrmR family transcriptional regulator